MLRRGSHAGPRYGGCLLEIAGALPGGPWSDRPLAVDPMLARMGRVINDRTSDAQRRRLLTFTPWLVGTASIGDERVTRTLCRLSAGRLDSGADPVTDRYLTDIAKAGSFDRYRARWSRRSRASALVQRAVQAIAGPDADDLLFAFLLEAVNEVRHLEDRHPIELEARDDWPTVLPVRVEVRIPDGSESRYLHCRAETDQWPQNLQKAWCARRQELRAAARHVPRS